MIRFHRRPKRLKRMGLFTSMSVIQILFITLAVSPACSVRCGDNLCSCNGVLATCQKNKRVLDYIPALPSNITRIRFTSAHFPNITKELFQNISKLEIQRLSFRDTHTVAISSNAFSSLPHLLKLEITQMITLKPDVLARSFSSLSASIEYLLLRDNKWNSLPPFMFDGLQNSSIAYINLGENRLQSFNGSLLLPKIPFLKEIDLTKNHIYTDSVDLRNMEYLRSLKLQDNILAMIPKLCGPEQKSLVPRLRSLDLSINGILSFKGLKCLPTLLKLTLNYNSVKKLSNNTFADLPSLTSLYLSKLGNLKEISELAFNISTLEKLVFTGNSFHFERKGTFHPSLYFKYCPNLRFLELTNNYLPSDSRIVSLFHPLTKMETLILQATTIHTLPSGIFDRMLMLKKLVLSGNSISSWNDDVFSKLKNLRNLYLEGNDITIINKTSLPTDLLAHLKVLNLGNNPFSCTCAILWFRDWLKTTNIDLQVYPQRYTCQTPDTWRNRRIVFFDYTEEDCVKKNPWVMVASILISFGVFCCIAVVIIYFQMPNIKNVIYMARLKCSGYVKFINEEQYTYDAFVIHSSSDDLWVYSVLIKQIEASEGLSLCIPQRNFGFSYIADEIENGMKNSRKLIVVLSNEFAKDEWCQWQVEMVQERIRQRGKETVVLILLSDIDSSHMTSSLRHLLKTNSYASWCNGKLQENLFWRVVISALKKPFGCPPVAVVD